MTQKCTAGGGTDSCLEDQNVPAFLDEEERLTLRRFDRGLLEMAVLEDRCAAYRLLTALSTAEGGGQEWGSLKEAVLDWCTKSRGPIDNV